jgi:hypothetical protein
MQSRWFWTQQSLEDTRAAVFQLQNSSWIDAYTTQVDVKMPTYNAQEGLLGLTEMSITLEPSGGVVTRFKAQGSVVAPYNSLVTLLLDVLLILLISLSLLNEVRAMRYLLQKNTGDGVLTVLRGYLTFWTAIDWINIIGTLNVAAQFTSLQASVSKVVDLIEETPAMSIHTSLNMSAFEKRLNATDWTSGMYETSFNNIVDESVEVNGKWDWLRIYASFFSVTLILRFFKSFRPNPRTNIVVNTMKNAQGDIAHFMVVLMIIFACFTILAHINFGPYMNNWSTLTTSFHNCFSLLMGEFDFWSLYAITPNFAAAWFWSFQILIYLIMLNMFLAIVMDVYTKVKVSVEDSQTFWAQLYRMWQDSQEHRRRRKVGDVVLDSSDAEGFLRRMNNAGLQKKDPLDIITAEMVQRACVEQAGLTASGKEAVGAAAQSVLDRLPIEEAERILERAQAFEDKEHKDACALRISDAIPALFRMDGFVSEVAKFNDEVLEEINKQIKVQKPPPPRLLAKCRNVERTLDTMLERLPAPPGDEDSKSSKAGTSSGSSSGRSDPTKPRNLFQRKADKRRNAKVRKSLVAPAASREATPELEAADAELELVTADHPAAQFSDEQLREAGWADEEIEALRAGQIKHQPRRRKKIDYRGESVSF